MHLSINTHLYIFFNCIKLTIEDWQTPLKYRLWFKRKRKCWIMIKYKLVSNDKRAYLQEIPRIWGCVLPDCQLAEHRPFWLAYTMRPLQTLEARARETIFIYKKVLKHWYIPHHGKPEQKIKYLHSEEAAQTSRTRCLDTLQPEDDFRHKN